jgi:hypothetical protein
MTLFCRWTGSVKEYLVHFTGVVKEESDGQILCGEFAKSRKPSDLAEEQGSYDEWFQKFKGLRQVWYQSLTLFVYFRQGKRERNLSHAAEKKRQTNTRSARGKGDVKRKG